MSAFDKEFQPEIETLSSFLRMVRDKQGKTPFIG